MNKLHIQLKAELKKSTDTARHTLILNNILYRTNKPYNHTVTIIYENNNHNNNTKKS